MEMACINLFQCMNIFFHWRYAVPKVRYSRRTLYYMPLNSCEKQQVAVAFENLYECFVVSFNDGAYIRHRAI